MPELMYVKFIRRLSRQRILMHALFWIAALIFFFYVFNRGEIPARTMLNSLGFMPGHMIFVYSLNYLLFPKYVLKGKIFSAILGLLLVLLLALIYLRIADVYVLHYSGTERIWITSNFPRSIFALFSIGWIAVSIKLVKRWYIEKEVQQQLEKEKLLVELQLLKSQLHPHFLFNTLNSLYSMTLERSPHAPEAVLKLSALLRHILYECNEPFVPLNNEIRNIRNYIELEQMRFRERLDISMNCSGNISDKRIAPLLLLPFVENSIKHGVSEQLDHSWISLHLHVEADTLSFKLINSKDDHAQHTPHTQGLGLQNVKKRLRLLYPDRHTLKLLPQEDTYTVSLTIHFPPSEIARNLSTLNPNQHEIKVSFS